jgi:hypothetical protein
MLLKSHSIMRNVNCDFQSYMNLWVKIKLNKNMGMI